MTNENIVSLPLPEHMDEATRKLIYKLVQRGPSGPYDGGMEARIAKLEANVEHIQSNMMDVKSRMGSMEAKITDVLVLLGKIDTELKHKVSYTWLAIYFAGIAALVLRSEIVALLR